MHRGELYKCHGPEFGELFFQGEGVAYLVSLFLTKCIRIHGSNELEILPCMSVLSMHFAVEQMKCFLIAYDKLLCITNFECWEIESIEE